MTGRNAGALHPGFEEKLVPWLPHLDDLDSPIPEEYRAALRVARAFLVYPLDVTPQLIEDARRFYSDVELILFMMAVETNKTTVTLGLDAGPVPPERRGR
jgi:hypothetical protein